MILQGEAFLPALQSLGLNAGLHEMEDFNSLFIISLQPFFSRERQGFKEAPQNLDLRLKLSRESLQPRHLNGRATDPAGDE